MRPGVKGLQTSGFIHTVDDVDSVPAMGGSYARICTAFENGRVKITVFFAFWAPECRGTIE